MDTENWNIDSHDTGKSFWKKIGWEWKKKTDKNEHYFRVERNSKPVAVGVNPCSAKYWLLKNLLKCRIPLSHKIVTIVWPGPKSLATLIAPTQFIADELPINKPSFLKRNLLIKFVQKWIKKISEQSFFIDHQEKHIKSMMPMTSTRPIFPKVIEVNKKGALCTGLRDNLLT